MKTMPAGVQRGFLKDILESTTTSIRPYIGLGSDLGGNKGRCLFAGSWNADIYPPLKAYVKPEDLQCAKNRMSGLVRTIHIFKSHLQLSASSCQCPKVEPTHSFSK